MASSFEQALGIAASSTALGGGSGGTPVVVDRDGVTGNPWLDDGSKTYTQTWNHVSWPPKLDMYWWTDYVNGRGMHYTYVTGANFNWSWFNDSSKPWQVFIHYPSDILHPLASWPYENDDYSPNSVTFAANMVTGINQLLEKWIPQFNSWADDVNAPGGDFQGSAAGVLKQHLTAFRVQLQGISDQLTNPGLAADLNSTAGNMVQVAKDLSAAFDSWWSSNVANPMTLLHNEFMWAMNHETTTINTTSGKVVTVSTPHGDPMTPAFWTSIETQAKSYWTQGLAPLDASGQNFISTLSSSYGQSSAALPRSIVSPPSPPTPQPNTGGGPGGGPGGGSPGGGGGIDGSGAGGGPGGGGGIDGSGAGGGAGGGADLSKLGGPGGGAPGGIDGAGAGGDLGAGLGGGPGGGGGIDGAGAGGLPGGLAAANLLGGGGPGAGGPGTGDPGALSFGGAGLGGQDGLTGPGGLPLGGPGGGPLTLPAGSKVAPDGSVTGPDGNPVLGSDGKPLKVPPGSTLTQDGSGLGGQDTLTGPDGKPLLGPGGSPLTVPAGSTIRPDGSVLGPNGKPLMGPDGKPLTVPAGSSLSQTGADGLPRTSTGTSPDDNEFMPTANPSGLARTSQPFGVGNTGGSPASGLSGLRQIGSGMGVSDRAKSLLDPEGNLESGAPAGAETAQEGQAMEEAAQEEQMMGRVATVGGAGAAGSEPPMMPPMSGGMGGVGGGGTSSRKTWVTEDEETWGTAPAAAPE